MISLFVVAVAVVVISKLWQAHERRFQERFERRNAEHWWEREKQWR